MTTIQRSALLPFSAEKVYTLINDIEQYPEYLEGCVGAEILSCSETIIEARLDLAKKGIRHSFVTRNSLTPPTSVKMQLVEGPFSAFEGEWTLQQLNENACKVTLHLDFEVSSKVLALAAKALFNPMADRLVDALVARAKVVFS